MQGSLTWFIEVLGMVIGLWLATYLVSHGFRSPVTRGTAVVLAAVAAGFFLQLLTHAQPSGVLSGWWTIVFTLALIGWYNLTRRLFAPHQRGGRAVALVVNGLGVAKMALVAVAMLRAAGPDNLTGQDILACCPTLYTVADYVFLLSAAAGILLNFRLGAATQYGPYVQPLWLASGLAAAAVVYNLASQWLPLPLVVRDALLVGGMALGGYAVARYQAFVEFRPLRRDLPTSALTTVVMVSAYGFLAIRFGASEWGVALVLALAVVTHAVQNVVHEGLDRVLNRNLDDFRHELRRLARQAPDEERLPVHLQAGLVRLVALLGSPGGFVAVRRGGDYTVLAAAGLRAVGEALPAEAATVAETSLRAGWGAAGAATWLVPAFAGDQQVAVIGLAPRMNGVDYGLADLDLLADVADWAGRLTAGEAQQRERRAELHTLAQALERGEAALQTQAQTLLTTLAAEPDRAFARAVESGLQQLSDYTRLGASPLVAQLRLPGDTHIERGKALRQQLLAAVESLRPAAKRPDGVLPREWQAYAVLHDAYVDDLPNREIMARLYISEGTYNRLRRRALQAVARALLEAQHSAGAQPAGAPTA